MLSGLNAAEYQLLKWIAPHEPDVCSGAAYVGKSKLAVLLGDSFLARVQGKRVIDFGCGAGAEAIELAKRGAAHVIGIDIREDLLETARGRASAAGVAGICEFGRACDRPADFIVALDSFEHFDDPAGILDMMDHLLNLDGEVVASFGPTWYHPYGGHLFSVFPWAHLLFSEAALIQWRSTFKSDGATRFRECQGGLNQITIRQFERIVQASTFYFAEMEAVPIRKLRWLHHRITREFTSSSIRCRLKRRPRKRGLPDRSPSLVTPSPVPRL